MKTRMAFVLLLIGLFASCGKKTPTLNLLVWEGYADPSFVKAFEEQNHCKGSASYMGSSDELVAKLRGGSAGNYDVISPSSDVATMISEAELASPLDLSKLPSYEQLSAKLRAMPLVRVNGKVYGVPFMWGPNPLIYDTTAFSKFPVGETIPKENTTGWIDHLMITAGSENKELAYKFLEYMIDAQTQRKVTDMTGYAPANSGAAQFMTPEQQKNLHLDNADEYQKRIYFWQNV